MPDAREYKSLLKQAEQAVQAEDFGRAHDHLRDALELQEAVLGPRHPDVASTLNNLAVVCETIDLLDEAELFYLRAHDIAAGALPPTDPLVITSRENLKDFRDARRLPMPDWPDIDGLEPSTVAPPAAPLPSMPAPLLDFTATETPPETATSEPALLPDEPVTPAPVAEAPAAPAPRGTAAPAAPAAPDSATETPVVPVRAAAAPSRPVERVGASGVAEGRTVLSERPWPPLAPAPKAWPRPLIAVLALLGAVGLVMLVVMMPSWRGAAPGDPVAGAAPEAASPRERSDPPPSPPSPATTPATAAASTAPAPESGAAPASTAASTAAATGAAQATAAPGVRVVVADMCASLVRGEPWDCQPLATPAAPGRAVFYTRIASPTDLRVQHRWYQGTALRQSASLAIGANPSAGYRTFSRLVLTPGAWRVELRTADGTLLRDVTFDVR